MFLKSLLVVALFLSPLGINGQFVCPIEDDLWFCSCHTEGYTLVICENYLPAIVNDFTAVRAANNLTDDDWLILDSLLISAFKTQNVLDLSPYAKTNFSSVNFNLGSVGDAIVGGTNSTEEVDLSPFKFIARSVEIRDTNFNDDGVATLLRFLDEPENMKLLWITESQLTQVPDILSLVNLQDIDLGGNRITKIGGGQFRNLNVDGILSFGLANNLINEIGEDAFLFYDPSEKGSTKDLYTKLGLGLIGNNLTDDKIHENHGLDSTDREIWIGLGGNYFEFISQSKWEKFLMANPLSMIWGQDNPWICDERMSWLKAKKDEYEQRVIGLTCTNDPGMTVFTSTLVP